LEDRERAARLTIDAAPSLEQCSGGCSGHSYTPRYPPWYRKHFKLPLSWNEGSAINLRFQGTFRETTIWLNGKNLSAAGSPFHISGYTSYTLRLDQHRWAQVWRRRERAGCLHRPRRVLATARTCYISSITGANGQLTAQAVLRASAEL
jgi:hypothetical protein